MLLNLHKTGKPCKSLTAFKDFLLHFSEKRPFEMEIFSKRVGSTPFQARFILTSPIIPLRPTAVKSYLTCLYHEICSVRSIQQQRKKTWGLEKWFFLVSDINILTCFIN